MVGHMQMKSEVVVLGAHLDDPSNRAGMKTVLQRLQPLVPVLDPTRGVCQKTVLIGDHAFSALGRLLRGYTGKQLCKTVLFPLKVSKIM